MDNSNQPKLHVTMIFINLICHLQDQYFCDPAAESKTESHFQTKIVSFFFSSSVNCTCMLSNFTLGLKFGIFLILFCQCMLTHDNEYKTKE